MSHGIARGAQLSWLVASTVGVLLLGGCDTLLSSETPLPPPSLKPSVTITTPTNGKAAAINEPVTIVATATDRSGILRVDLLVNEAVVDSQTLFVASPRFEYRTIWKPTVVGQITLTIVAYNVNNVASDPVSVAVSVSGAAVTATALLGTPTLTPFVIFITASPPPSSRPAITPVVTVVTATPPATSTPSSAGVPVQPIVPTATGSRTVPLASPTFADETQIPH